MKKNESVDGRNYVEKIDIAADLGLDILISYLKNEIQGSDRVKAGIAAVTQKNKYLATQANRHAVMFAMARCVANNKEDLKMLVSGSELMGLLPEARLIE